MDGRFRVACFLEVVLYFIENKQRFLDRVAAASTASSATRSRTRRLASTRPQIKNASSAPLSPIVMPHNNTYFSEFRASFQFPTILWHDFNRTGFQVALAFASIVERAESMVVLKVHDDLLDPSAGRLNALWQMREGYKFVPG